MTQHQAIASFLDALERLADSDGNPWYVGQIFLVNLFDSHEQGLVKAAVIAAFLRDCAQYIADDPGAHPMNVIDAVRSMHDELTPRYLRLCKQPNFDPDSMVSTVVRYSVFVRHHYDDKKARLSGEQVLPQDLPEPSSRLTAERWKRAVHRATQTAGWHLAEARLGREHENCWVSVDQFPDPQSQELYNHAHSAADRARDELGLVDSHDHLIKYSFSAATCLSAAARDVARPTFADGGNRRFLTTHKCPRFEQMAQAGWGCTLHLGRFPVPEYHPPSGRPERVTRSIMLGDLDDVKVEYLSATTQPRGDGDKDDDAAFLSFILTGLDGRPRSIADIKQAILRLLTASEVSEPAETRR